MDTIPLSDLRTGQSGIIVKVLGHGAFRKRVMEMGFVKGKKITAVLAAPLNDPVKYRIMGYEVSLRRSEAKMIEVVPIPKDEEERADTAGHPTSDSVVEDEATESSAQEAYEKARRTINVALIGNPNCGKTSLFNIASGAQEHVGNYSGVTVDSKTGTFQHGGYTFVLVDLPGTYSLSAYSPEEKYVRTYLRDNDPDVILNVIDASNLERNLYLTTELIDMDHPMVIALNMYDELRRTHAQFNYKALGEMIGVPIVPTVSRSGEGVDELFDTIIRVYEHREPSVRHIHIALGHDLEEAITPLKNACKADKGLHQHYCGRYLAMRLLAKDPEAEEALADSPERDELLKMRDQALAHLLEEHPDEDVSAQIAAEKYGFISGALAETYTRGKVHRLSYTHIIDAFVTNRLFGFPIFLGVMLFIFWMTFFVGQYPMDWMEAGVDALASGVERWIPEGALKDLIANGIIGGVGGVIVFLPNILILFFFISFMEDSGYMARAAFIMDRLMHHIGLHGKSFIPMVMGFGCNVPAIMAARTIESRSSKFITVLITPFMSCSARLPVYVLLIGIFFEAHAAWVFLGMYVLGVVVAMLTAKLLRRFWFKRDETPFVMELPPYRLPAFRTTVRHMWWKGKQYLKKMGGVILVAAIVVWALDYFPLRSQEDSSQDSYLHMIGKAVQPVLEPIGIGWRPTVAVLAGIPAKEIVVSTLGVLYTGSDEATDTTLAEKLTRPMPGSDQPDFTPAMALAFMIFILLYTPCLATIVAIAKETHSWRYASFSIVYHTCVAWVFAFVAYRIMLWFA